jgi:hypothetical protein
MLSNASEHRDTNALQEARSYEALPDAQCFCQDCGASIDGIGKSTERQIYREFQQVWCIRGSPANRSVRTHADEERTVEIRPRLRDML